VSVRQNHTKNI